MDIPHLKAGHIIAADEVGVVDPANNAPDHVPFQQYLLNPREDGAVFHDIWLAVKRPTRLDIK